MFCFPFCVSLLPTFLFPPHLLSSILINNAGCSTVAGLVLSHNHGLWPCPALEMSCSSVILHFLKEASSLCPQTMFTPNPMAEMFFKDLNIWMSVCSYLKVIPLCNMKLYGMNTFKLSNTTSITRRWKPKPSW